MRTESRVTPEPVLNGCYIAPHTDMVKVKMLCYRGECLNQVLVEDLYGRVRRFNMEEWQGLNAIPCCLTGLPNRRAAQS